MNNKCLIEGAIPSNTISYLIEKDKNKIRTGAFVFFLGQVREDNIANKTVKAIEYSAYEEMAEKEIFKIKEKYIKKFELSSLHIFHSIGIVKTGEVSLLVMASAKHRTQLFKVLEQIVEDIKNKVPIWKKELFQDKSYRWVK